MAQDWRVVSQRSSTELGPSGQFRDVMIVTFQLTDGTVGNVTVATATYEPATVATAIGARAAQMAAVADLAGTTGAAPTG